MAKCNLVFIIFGLVLICAVGFLCSFIFAIVHNLRLTNYIKKENYQLWLDEREKSTVGIRLPVWLFNPFSLPDKYRKKNDEDFVRLKKYACLGRRCCYVCFAIFFLSIVIAFVIALVAF